MILRIKNCTVEVPLPSGTSISVHKQLPKNFGHVTETLFRGSFPTRQHVVTMQRELGIEHIVTLHSNQAAELLAVARLKQELPSNIFLHEVLLSDVPSYLMAGQLVVSLEGPTYVHCTFGANRTGKVVLVTQIALDHSSGQVVSRERLQRYLSQALEHGFDFDKPHYKRVLEEILERLLSEGKIDLAL